MSDFKDFYSNNTRIKRLSLSSDSRLIIMSDMHRGDGTGSDDFAHNSLIYKCALDYYLENGFTYIELGDAEEMGPDVRCPMSDVRFRRSDVRGRKVKTDVGGRRSDVGCVGKRQTSEVRCKSRKGGKRDRADKVSKGSSRV